MFLGYTYNSLDSFFAELLLKQNIVFAISSLTIFFNFKKFNFLKRGFVCDKKELFVIIHITRLCILTSGSRAVVEASFHVETQY